MSKQSTVKDRFIDLIHRLQNDICSTLESCDGKATFRTDEWQRDGGGGGITKVIANGDVFEKGGVNTSVVFGKVTEAMRNQLRVDGDKWFACGLSIVIHPCNPMVPTVHCNYRFFELYDKDDHIIDCWFGGGTDLTPYYLFEDDARHFHAVYKNTCDALDPALYFAFKHACDDYFVNKHRNNERRGIGGIFYDYQRPVPSRSEEFWFGFAEACGRAFTDAYVPIVEKRKNAIFSKEQKHWQEIRRGRYVEFNLIHDKGTLFGLHTNGRTESILMSLPPTVRFEYDFKASPGSEEGKLIEVLMSPKEWA